MKQAKKQLPTLPGLLEQLSPKERADLLGYLDVSRTTLWRYQEAPGSTPVEHANIIALYLSAVLGDQHSISTVFGLSARQFGDRVKVKAKAA